MASQAFAVPSGPSPATGPLPTGHAGIPSVLVVDDDRHCIGQCTAMLAELGYPHHGAGSAREALEILHAQPEVRILMANVQLATLDGFALIEEARVRAGEARPIAAVMIAERPTTEMAIRGLHVEAVDFLSKPLALDAYSAALRRAMRYLGARRATLDGTGISDFGEQIGKLVAALEGQNGDGRPEARAAEPQIASTLRNIIAARGMRSRHFPSELFADPAWDILLDLTRAQLDNQQVSVSSVCIAASVPMSTALRWVRQMTDAGLLRRWTDPKDRRRDLIALTPATSANMMEYLATARTVLGRT